MALTESGLYVEIEKLGGGAIGKSYDGTWRYIISGAVTGQELMRGQDLVTGVPYTHAEAAQLAAEMYLAMCRWYATCDNNATGTVEHPILGAIPCCLECATKHELTLKEGT